MDFLHESAIFFCAAIVSVPLFKRFGFGSVLGYLITGFGRVGQIVGRMLTLRHIPFTALERSPEQVDIVRGFGNQVYYGEPARLDLLRAAHADKAKIFVLGIDNAEDSLRIAQVVRRHFPQVDIYATARDRFHALRLMDLGVKYFIRETFQSSLKLSEAVFAGLR